MCEPHGCPFAAECDRLKQENAHLRAQLEQQQQATAEARAVAGRLMYRYAVGPDADAWRDEAEWLEEARCAARDEWTARHIPSDDPGELKEWQDFDPDC